MLKHASTRHLSTTLERASHAACLSTPLTSPRHVCSRFRRRDTLHMLQRTSHQTFPRLDTHTHTSSPADCSPADTLDRRRALIKATCHESFDQGCLACLWTALILSSCHALRVIKLRRLITSTHRRLINRIEYGRPR